MNFSKDDESIPIMTQLSLQAFELQINLLEEQVCESPSQRSVYLAHATGCDGVEARMLLGNSPTDTTSQQRFTRSGERNDK